MAMKRKRSLRLVPLRIMVSQTHLDFINGKAEAKGESQGGIVRELINRELAAINKQEIDHDKTEGI